MFNGTAANSLALASLCQSYHSIICARTAHVETDECGAPEFFSNGTKVLLAPSDDGKISPEAVETMAKCRSDIHYPKPRAVSLTQSTELGTTYAKEELDRIREAALRHGLRIHMDGARFANAVAHLNLPPKEVTWKAGVDVLCFGGTKMGLPFGEAVIFFDRRDAHEFDYRCKQAGQLASKMRFVAAPWIGMIRSGAWLTHAAHANSMAGLLESRVRGLPGVSVLYPVQANSVFLRLSPEITSGLRKRGWVFHTFIGEGARFMCSWATKEADVEELARDIHGLSSHKPA